MKSFMYVSIPVILSVLFIQFILFLFPLSIGPVQSQSGDGLEITPTVQWSQNLEGTFSYCVYEGTVTLDSVNDPQAFCIIPTTDLSFANMQSFEDDGFNTYDLNPIKTPAGLFKDGAPYSVCHICSTIARCWI